MSFISCNYCMKKGHVYKNYYAMDVPKRVYEMDPKRIKKGLTMLDSIYQRVQCNINFFYRS